jgi:hypothetical protein
MNFPEGKLMATRFAADILAAGEPAITEMVKEGREETLHLEFKTLSSDAALNRDDRKMVAKAICGFANAEGGLLILGIETKKIDRVDAAFRKRPIKNLDRIRRLITAGLPEMLSPQHNGVELTAIASQEDETQGFLLIDVHPSDDRPHMSVPDRRYFRRGSDGTRVLDHAEIRELMFSAREGVLEIEWTIRTGASSAQLYALWLLLTLRNTGRIPVVAPYVRLKSGQQSWGASPSLKLHPRASADGFYGIYTSRDFLIHLNDETGFAEYETGLDLRGTGQQQLKSAVAIARTAGMEHTYSMASWAQMHHGGLPAAIGTQVVQVEGFYGAENATVKDFRFKIDKADVLERFCRHMSIG